ncbi:Thiol:disulfide interchange protein DsbE [Candidatus Terasakiella magnetica]|uniref:Thiol:disulfide interchange protein DsbE n=1 Tax=Candidatus Terasakiella magnetica TaxID=1867952 RepID=A0A1C3RIE0_9PROT|nr:DsbE family thiol:disulfide interchange protein [Candidatus Terasakiella magnetica]SCA57032.1 Thiol:disulfide interchange protein DsbE [Candidatus Terasakiella magnetica]
MNSRIFFLIPLIGFCVLAVYFAVGLTKDPSKLDTDVLTNQPMGNFKLIPVKGRTEGLTIEDVKGEVSLVNFFGSWCVACLQEHPFLLKLKAENIIKVYGVDWDEKNSNDVVRWLARHGDPYTKIGVDTTGETIIDWGITGAPETFIVDKQGLIRYKHLGPITPRSWNNTLFPLIKELRKQ